VSRAENITTSVYQIF